MPMFEKIRTEQSPVQVEYAALTGVVCMYVWESNMDGEHLIVLLS